jgi:hypothetical protein
MARNKNTKFKRNRSSKEPYDSVLIVCEDTKSSRYYLEGMICYLRLSSVNIQVMPCPTGSDPKNVVDYAANMSERLEKSGNKPDRVYCVVDRDSHQNFDSAKSKIENLGHSYYFIYLEPCYEFWLLLHFKEYSAPFSKTGKKSICDKVNEEFKKEMPEYNKSDPEIFDKLKDKLDIALKNSIRRRAEADRDGSSNPSTNFHELVAYLKNLKSSLELKPSIARALPDFLPIEEKV